MRSAAVPLLLLAACNSQPSVVAENASIAEVAAKVEAAGGTDNFVRPGQWQSTVTIDEMGMPGMPPEAAAQMKKMTAQSHVVQSCLTPEQAKKPDPEFFSGADNKCRYEKFSMTGGKIDMTMKCSGAGQAAGASTMHMAGTYSPDAYQMAMESQTESGGGMGPMTMKMRVDAKRTGECKAPAKAG